MKRVKLNSKAKLLIFAVSIYVIYVLISQQVCMFKYNREIDKNNQKIAEQEKETKQLIKEKNKYKSDEFIERIAREKLGYVKPGEKVYIDKSAN